jgi:hypothetical protein
LKGFFYSDDWDAYKEVFPEQSLVSSKQKKGHEPSGKAEQYHSAAGVKACEECTFIFQIFRKSDRCIEIFFLQIQFRTTEIVG